jgi:hypothetical protein
VSDACQYCGAERPPGDPRTEVGWLYGIECRRCPPGARRSLVLARPAPVEALACPDCGSPIAPAGSHPDVLVVKEMTYELCPACGERCGVASVVKHRDVSNGTM